MNVARPLEQDKIFNQIYELYKEEDEYTSALSVLLERLYFILSEYIFTQETGLISDNEELKRKVISSHIKSVKKLADMLNEDSIFYHDDIVDIVFDELKIPAIIDEKIFVKVIEYILKGDYEAEMILKMVRIDSM